MKRTLFFGLLLLAACSQAPVPTPGTEASADPELIAQRLGTRADDAATSAAVDTKLGAVYVMGVTEGSLGGKNKGETDIILQRYNRSGKVVWKRQFGTSGYDGAGAIATDSKGFLYAAYTLDLSNGSVNKLEKFYNDGSLIWSRTVKPGDANGSAYAYVTALSADKEGNLYVAGAGGAGGESMFLSKYSGAGSLLWTRDVEGGGLFFYPTSVGTDAGGNAYVTVNEVDDSYITNTILKYSPTGKQLFDKTISAATNDLELTGLQIQGDALYLVGTKHYNWAGDLDKPYDDDGFVAQYSLSGDRVWQQGFGTKSFDDANGISADPSGVYVTGFTYGTLAGRRVGGSDIFLRKFSTGGSTLWTKQIGSAGDDYGNAVVAYSKNELYLAGSAGGALKGTTHRGGQDGFLRRTDGAGNIVWTDQ